MNRNEKAEKKFIEYVKEHYGDKVEFSFIIERDGRHVPNYRHITNDQNEVFKLQQVFARLLAEEN